MSSPLATYSAKRNEGMVWCHRGGGRMLKTPEECSACPAMDTCAQYQEFRVSNAGKPPREPALTRAVIEDRPPTGKRGQGLRKRR